MKPLPVVVLAALMLSACTGSDAGDQDGGDTADSGPTGTTRITATGAGFGAGPTVVFWFTARNPETRTSVDMVADPEIGSFSGIRSGSGSTGGDWDYWFDEAAGRSFVPAINNSGVGGSYYSRNVDMGASAEVEGYLISYRSFVPEGYSFPGVSTTGWLAADYAPTGSSFKSSWVTQNGDNTVAGDLILWSHSGGGALTSAGNGASWLVSDSDSHWVGGLSLFNTPDHSPRVLAYLRVPAGFASGDAVTTEWRLVSSGARQHFEGQKGLTSNQVPLDHRVVAFAGWADPDRNGQGTEATTQVLYGDTYVARGPSARARIEIGDDANYEDCRWLFIAPPTSWADTSVSADFYDDELARATHWFVTTADGTRYSEAL